MQNFGCINNAFNEILIDGIIRKDTSKNKKFGEYIKALKENKILSTQYLIYRNIESKIESDPLKATEYIKENISLMRHFSLKEIDSVNRNILKILGENNKLLKLDYPLKKLHKNIAFLINNENSITKIDEKINVRSTIAEHIIKTESKCEINENVVPTSMLAEATISKFNEKYSDLDETIKSTIKIIIESNKQEQELFFKDTLKRCIILVNENLKTENINIKERLLDVKDKLLNMEYTDSTFYDGISKLISLENDLKD